jgi:hypothetical protein
MTDRTEKHQERVVLLLKRQGAISGRGVFEWEKVTIIGYSGQSFGRFS